MRISDWSSDVCSSDLNNLKAQQQQNDAALASQRNEFDLQAKREQAMLSESIARQKAEFEASLALRQQEFEEDMAERRSEEHTSELQSLMRISYAVFCLKKKKTDEQNNKVQKQIPTDYVDTCGN